MANTKNIIKNGEAVFEKAAFLSSKSFEKQRDLLNVILEDGKKYTTKEVGELLKKEKNRKVEY